MAAPTPIQIHIPPTLQQHKVSLATFLSTRPQYTTIAVGAFVFSHNRLLLVQRAANERFANLWEVPGGGCEPGDPTILHSVARETFEETGLMLTRFIRQIGDGQEFVCSKGPCLKLSFEIEVQGLEGQGMGHRLMHGEDKESGKEQGHDDTVGRGAEITLDPEEHEDYVWATEEDVRTGRYPGMSAEQQALMLKAFELRSVEYQQLKAAINSTTKRTSA